MNTLHDLAHSLDGELLTDEAMRTAHARDASPYRVTPLAIAQPRHARDCATLIAFANDARIPLVPRAAGTSLAGQCVGTGIVVDCSRHMNRILAIDTENRCAVVEPGVTPLTLNTALAGTGLRFAPDPSTSDRCHLAGMAGNNAWGAHAPRDGTMRDHVHAMDVLCGDGTSLAATARPGESFDRSLMAGGSEGALLRGLYVLIDENLSLIRERYPHGVPNNMGYALDVLAGQRPFERSGPPFNLAPFLCGSEGTLAMITQLTVRLVPETGASRVLACAFPTLDAALDAVPIARSHEACAVELLDRALIDIASGDPEHARAARLFGDCTAGLLIELDGEDDGAALSAAHDLQRRLGESHAARCMLADKAESAALWALRRAALTILLSGSEGLTPVTGIEDGAVPIDRLREYATATRALLDRHGLRAIVYGSVSMGLMHFRPFLDLDTAAGRTLYARLIDDMAELVTRFGGTLSSKHGDGRLRAHHIATVLGGDILPVLHEVKRLFDPGGVLNPGKILAAPPVTRDLSGRAEW